MRWSGRLSLQRNITKFLLRYPPDRGDSRRRERFESKTLLRRAFFAGRELRHPPHFLLRRSFVPRRSPTISHAEQPPLRGGGGIPLRRTQAWSGRRAGHL